MNDKLDTIQAQFNGFYNTPHLFLKPVYGLNPLLKPKQNTPVFKGELLKNVRLGQRVERFVTQELLHYKTTTILIENAQIQATNKQTIGELDCLILDHLQPVHLEIQFKYYLYDATLGTTEIDHCIGPNRLDSLNQKLSKLKTKQLPLLYSQATKPLLDTLNIKAENFAQYIYFKAQIFIPYGETIHLKTLNPNCIYGFYFKHSELPKFKDCKFYKPQKTDWLLDVTTNVNWKTFEDITPELKAYKTEGYSIMLWLKKPNGEISKCFVVAW